MVACGSKPTLRGKHKLKTTTETSNLFPLIALGVGEMVSTGLASSRLWRSITALTQPSYNYRYTGN